MSPPGMSWCRRSIRPSCRTWLCILPSVPQRRSKIMSGSWTTRQGGSKMGIVGGAKGRAKGKAKEREETAWATTTQTGIKAKAERVGVTACGPIQTRAAADLAWGAAEDGTISDATTFPRGLHSDLALRARVASVVGALEDLGLAVAQCLEAEAKVGGVPLVLPGRASSSTVPPSCAWCTLRRPVSRGRRHIALGLLTGGLRD
mmetsp:Transcript_87203/g.199106  ORF Transcript_87203/g.199106 Transcript_87203/m.199106 type:complete len:203 (-) Transcript_87203:3-611(-)